MSLVVEEWPIDRLTEYGRNPRKNDEQVDRMAGAIREFGFRIPIVARSDGLVVDGHLRLKAARKLGLATVSVALADELSEAQIKAFRLLANRSANWASWDNDLLSLELGELQAEGFDLALTGFDPGELAGFLADPTEGLTDPDDVPEPPADPVSVLGDVWLLGKHRIVCGDSTDALVVEKALNGIKPHLMVTDPPYGVAYDADWRNKALRSDGSPIAGRAIGKVLNDDKADWSETWALFPGEVAYVWQGDKQITDMARQLVDNGFVCRNLIVWAKLHFAIGRGDYHPQHETCWYAVRKTGKGHWNGDRKQTTLWQIPKPAKSETGHSTQKPVECMKRPIENNSSPGQAVYEPFSGSGTTIIACEMTSRCALAIELNPAYVDVAVKRWQEFTGQTATLEADGRTFAEVAGART